MAISSSWLVDCSRDRCRPRATARRKPSRSVREPLVVVLDPGHGGQDSGAMCGTMLEKDLTLDVALRAELLLRSGRVLDRFDA